MQKEEEPKKQFNMEAAFIRNTDAFKTQLGGDGLVLVNLNEDEEEAEEEKKDKKEVESGEGKKKKKKKKKKKRKKSTMDGGYDLTNMASILY